MKKIIPEIYVENCKEALEFYKEVFGGELKNVQNAGVNPMFKEYGDKIVHSELHINENCVIYFYDILKETQRGETMHVLLELDSEEEINKIYKGLSEEGNVHYELQKTFWGAFHAVLTDKYGVKWGLNYSLR